MFMLLRLLKIIRVGEWRHRGSGDIEGVNLLEQLFTKYLCHKEIEEKTMEKSTCRLLEQISLFSDKTSLRSGDSQIYPILGNVFYPFRF